MEIVITGASSFLGRALCRRLSPEHRLYLLRHSIEDMEKFAGQPLFPASGEAEELCFCRALPERADVWIHLAWGGAGSGGRSDEAQQEANVEMSMRALSCAAKLSCRHFFFAGSQAEYGRGAGKGMQTEETPCMPVSAYGKAKLLFGQMGARWAESFREEEETALRFVHLRIFSVYGAEDHPGTLIKSCLAGFREDAPMLLGPCTQDWNYLYITDAADAVAALLEKPSADGIYNIASLDTRPLRSYIEELHMLCKSKSELHFGARADNAEGGVHLRPSIERLTKESGWSPGVTFSEGIRRMRELSGEKRTE